MYQVGPTGTQALQTGHYSIVNDVFTAETLLLVMLWAPGASKKAGVLHSILHICCMTKIKQTHAADS